MKSIICCSLLIFCFLNSNAQVGEAKKRAESNKSGGGSTESSSYSSSGNVGGSSFFGDIFGAIFITVFYEAQLAQLDNAKNEDWRTSLEANVRGGVNLNQIEYFDSQTIRGNWGLYSTQIRRVNVRDITGDFTTLDWQILQLNLINRERFRWLMGFGISHEIEVDQTHFEWTTEVSASFFDKRFIPALTYRESDDGYPRKEFSAFLEYRPYQKKSVEFSASVGYVYQSLYDISFNFPSVGIGFYLK